MKQEVRIMSYLQFHLTRNKHFILYFSSVFTYKNLHFQCKSKGPRLLFRVLITCSIIIYTLSLINMKLRKKTEKQVFVVFITVQCPIDDPFSVILHLSFNVIEKLSKKKKITIQTKNLQQKENVFFLSLLFLGLSLLMWRHWVEVNH